MRKLWSDISAAAFSFDLAACNLSASSVEQFLVGQANFSL